MRVNAGLRNEKPLVVGRLTCRPSGLQPHPVEGFSSSALILSFEVAAAMSANSFTEGYVGFQSCGQPCHSDTVLETSCKWRVWLHQMLSATRSEQHRRYRCQDPNCLRRRAAPREGESTAKRVHLQPQVMEHVHHPCPGEWLISL